MSDFVFPHTLKKRWRVSVFLPILIAAAFILLIMLSVLLLTTVAETRISARSLAPLLLIPIYWTGFALFAPLAFFPRMVLQQDHAAYRNYWIKREIFYRDIDKIEAEYQQSIINSSNLTLLFFQKNGSSVKMSIGAFAPKECVVLLNILKSCAPDAAMNDLARQIKNGDVPAV